MLSYFYTVVTMEFYHTHILELISSNSKLDSLPHYFEQILKLMLLVWAREGQVLSKITHGKYGDFPLFNSTNYCLKTNTCKIIFLFNLQV